MKNAQLQEIQIKYPDMSPEVIINAVSKRVRQLNSGSRPLVRVENKSVSEVALQEILEGKIAVVLPVEEEETGDSSKKSRRRK